MLTHIVRLCWKSFAVLTFYRIRCILSILIDKLIAKSRFFSDNHTGFGRFDLFLVIHRGYLQASWTRIRRIIYGFCHAFRSRCIRLMNGLRHAFWSRCIRLMYGFRHAFRRRWIRIKNGSSDAGLSWSIRISKGFLDASIRKFPSSCW